VWRNRRSAASHRFELCCRPISTISKFKLFYLIVLMRIPAHGEPIAAAGYIDVDVYLIACDAQILRAQAGIEQDAISAAGAVKVDHRVMPIAAAEAVGIVANAADEDVVAMAIAQDVVACIAKELIIAAAAV